VTTRPETTAELQGERKRGRQFKPGQSGNPAGRPPGARHKTTLAIEALLEGEAEALTRKAIELAKAGDGPALRLCLDRLAPPRRDAPIAIELPTVASIQDAVAASSAVLAAVAAGDCTPDEGGRVMALLTAHKTIVEVGELERRITSLEERDAK
jgi:hypothetical protein